MSAAAETGFESALPGQPEAASPGLNPSGQDFLRGEGWVKRGVFISYARKDAVRAEKVIARFEAVGFSVWTAYEQLQSASNMFQELCHAIQTSNALVALTSPSSVVDWECDMEVEHAIMLGKRVIPVIVEDVEPSQVPSEELRAINWIFAREKDDIEVAWKKYSTPPLQPPSLPLPRACRLVFNESLSSDLAVATAGSYPQ